jgi:hypothetical protein
LPRFWTPCSSESRGGIGAAFGYCSRQPPVVDGFGVGLQGSRRWSFFDGAHSHSHPPTDAARLAFRQLLGADEFVPQPELAPLRAQVAANCGRLVAAMSRIRLGDVTQQVGGERLAALGV